MPEKKRALFEKLICNSKENFLKNSWTKRIKPRNVISGKIIESEFESAMDRFLVTFQVERNIRLCNNSLTVAPPSLPLGDDILAARSSNLFPFIINFDFVSFYKANSSLSSDADLRHVILAKICVVSKYQRRRPTFPNC